MKHSRLLSPSASGLWIPCTAMPMAKDALNLPDQPSPAADRGTLQHNYAELRMKGVRKDGCPVELDPDEWDQVVAATDSVNEYFKEVNSGDAGKHKDYHEFEVAFTDEWRKDCFGTTDYLRLDFYLRAMFILDYKFGRVPVDPKENSQLMIYGLAAIDTFKREKLIDLTLSIDHVVIGIAQPKVSKKLQVWNVTMQDLLAWDREVLQPAQIEVQSGKGKFTPGPHCMEKYCKIKRNCGAVLQKMEGEMDDFMEMYKPQALDLEAYDPHYGGLAGLPIERLAKFLDNVSIIRGLCDEAEQIAFDTIEQGGEFPGYKIIHGQGKRKWRDEAEADKFLTGKIKAEEKYKKTLITAPQAEKLLLAADKLKATVTKKRFEELTEYVPGSLKLVPESDPHPAVVKEIPQEEIDADIADLFNLGSEPEPEVIGWEIPIDELDDLLSGLDAASDIVSTDELDDLLANL